MKTLLRQLLVAAGLLAGTGCAKTTEPPTPTPPCDCPPLVVKPTSFMWPTVGPTLNYARPVFNPADAREVAYLRGSTDEGPLGPFRIGGLWVGSLATRQQRPVLLGNDMYLQVRWGAGGWLALSKGDQIWKIKATGDSLTQLTNGPAHYQPQWSPDGQRLVCFSSGNGAADQHLELLAKDGTRLPMPSLEALNGYAEAWAPDGNQLLVGLSEGSRHGLGIYDFRTGRARFLVANQPAPEGTGDSCFGAAWLPDSQAFVWCTGGGVFRTDAATGATTRLRAGCFARTYLHPSVSANGQQLIVERTDQKAIEDGTKIYAEIALWTMNIDGSNERKVEF
ncbi:MAG: hypothetical protein M3Y12_13760 [Bacteroidota bacterium]|nr:hypothetical protein [Bacteroidota bacterium]